jgi:hypothetical protein
VALYSAALSSSFIRNLRSKPIRLDIYPIFHSHCSLPNKTPPASTKTPPSSSKFEMAVFKYVLAAILVAAFAVVATQVRRTDLWFQQSVISSFQMGEIFP